jgi:hypothetical protein
MVIVSFERCFAISSSYGNKEMADKRETQQGHNLICGIPNAIARMVALWWPL